MWPAYHYRKKAAELNATAKLQTDNLRRELEHLALAYLRLADQAERNFRTDVVYGHILPPRSGRGPSDGQEQI